MMKRKYDTPSAEVFLTAADIVLISGFSNEDSGEWLDEWDD